MAPSNSGASSEPQDPGSGGESMRPGSPAKSQDALAVANPQQECSYVARHPHIVEISQSPHASVSEGSKKATTHDFLSLYGVKPGGEPPSARGAMATLDFFQPLDKGERPPSFSTFPHGFVTTAGSINHLHYNNTQETAYALANRTLELPSNSVFRAEGGECVTGVERFQNFASLTRGQLKFGSSDLGCVPKTTSSQGQSEISYQHAPTVSKQWQQMGLEPFNLAKRAPRMLSEDEEDEEDEFTDPSRDQRKDDSSRKFDSSQKSDGKNNENKVSTPRSKHSATEQRRRSKINSRFQMLRQLVPNSDQKRDKASFLLEVIEYIQYLQVKAKKYEATEHEWQQQKLRSILWDVGQRSAGMSDSTVDAPHVRNSTRDAPHVDSLVCGKELVPAISTISFDMKQGTDANGLVRPRLTPVVAVNECEVSPPESLSKMGHVSMYLDKYAEVPQGCRSVCDNKVVVTKPIPITLLAQPPVYPAFGRSAGHVFHSSAHTASEIHATANCLLEEQHALPPSPNLKIPLHNKIEAVHGQHFLGSNLLPAENRNYIEEQKQAEPHVGQSEIVRQDLEKGNSLEELITEKPKVFPEVQLSGAGFSRQLLNEDAAVLGTSNGKHDVGVSKGEPQKEGGAQVEEQDLRTIQGGVIDFSRIYSQGLLDTLTRALQNSGLDMSQASISVQLDLGKPGEGVAATSTKAVAVNVDVSQQSLGHQRQAEASPDLELPKKKSKIESNR